VVENPIARIELSAERGEVATGDVVRLRARGLDRAGRLVTGVPIHLSLSARPDDDLGQAAGAQLEQDGRGQPAPDPSCYLAATTRSEPGTAPAGGEALYVLVHTPYLRPEHDWQQMLPEYRQVIVDKLKRCGGMPDIEERIVFERTLTPQDIHDRYRVLDGAIYGLASHGRFMGAFKPGNRSRQVEGLYLAGGAAHPGPGMPLVMMSGWIAADCFDQDQKSQAAA